MHPADPELAALLEEADCASAMDYAAAQAKLAPAMGSRALAVGDGQAIFAGPASPLNRVHNLGMRAPVTPDQLRLAEEFFAARAEATRVDLCPLAHPSLTTRLAERGYTVAAFKQVWWRTTEHMTRGLGALPDAPATVYVAPVTTPAERDLWAETVAMAFSGAGTPPPADLAVSRPTAYKANSVCYLAWLGDRPVAGGALALHGPVAVCYSTAVHPSARRMGVQHALLRVRIQAAAEQGSRLLMVQTTPGSPSQRNVARFGFRLAYTKPTVRRQHVAGAGGGSD